MIGPNLVRIAHVRWRIWCHAAMAWAVVWDGRAADLARPSFADAVQAAWSQSPERTALEGERGAAAARANAGQAFFPDGPTLTGQFADDHFRPASNLGYTTYVGQLTTPVWLPGEGGATVRTAEADVARIGASSEAAHLGVARQVLEAAANLVLAADETALARQRLAASRSLAIQAQRLARAGEQPLIDSQAADGALATSEIAASDAQAQEEAARESFRVLTGLDTAPDLTAPPAIVTATQIMPGQADIERQPEMLAASRALQAADANLRLIRIGDRPDPQVGVQVIRQRQFQASWDTQYGVVVTLPFGSRARNLPRIAAAESQHASALAELERSRRRVLVDLTRSWAQLAAARRAQGASARAAAALGMRQGEIERAWRLGEMPEIEVIRAQQLAFDARATEARNKVLIEAATWRMAFAEGILP